VQRDLVALPGVGMSVMEISHRSATFEGIIQKAEADIRALAGVPANYKILFLQGGASLQFSMVPLNLLTDGLTADYVMTGSWAEKASKEAKRVGKVNETGSTKAENFNRIPAPTECSFTPGAAYVHITSNNTIEGTQWASEPSVEAPLVCDASSDIFSRPIDVSKYGLIYAGAQKNLGPSGVTLVIARKDFVEAGRKDLPKIYQYRTFAANNSLYNTPPTFAIYLVRNVLAWIKSVGGPAQLQAWNEEKGRIVYGAIDEDPEYYRSPIARDSRSLMNIVFRLPSEALEEQFVKESTKAGLIGLKGHRNVGGIRASTYNAVSVDDCKKLADFMRGFAKKNRG